jgi:hypothetical protein
MKLWIDKQGGRHYHKEGCKMIGYPYHYEPVVKQPRRNKYGEWRDIIVDGKRYSYCPICFGYKRL